MECPINSTADFLAWILWSTELLIYLCCLLFIIIAIKLLHRDKILHFTFKALMAILCCRGALHFIFRTLTIFSDVIVSGAPIEEPILIMRRFTYIQQSVVLVTLAVERSLAIVDVDYAGRFTSTLQKMLFVGCVMLPGFIELILDAVVDVYLDDTTIYSIMFVAYTISGATVAFLYRLGRSRYERRHLLGLQLNQKFASIESVRSACIFLPVLGVELGFAIVQALLSLYSSLFTPYKLGKDPTKLSHVYDLTSALQHLFIPLYISWQLHRLRRNSIAPESGPRTQETELYFNSYRAMWK